MFIPVFTTALQMKAIGYEDLDWIHLAKNGNQWWTLVNTVMNL
jgi:hypothetical protein